MNALILWILLELMSLCFGSDEKIMSNLGYWKAQMKISYLDTKLNVWKSEKAEVGR
jgi:hypothetical protein